jgi:hypothetical protein
LYGINHDVWYAHHYGVHSRQSGRWAARVNQNYGMHIAEDRFEAQMESIRQYENIDEKHLSALV